MAITSKDNEKLKTVRKLNARRRDRDHLGMFVAEGEDLVQAAREAGWEPVELLAAAGSGLPGDEVDPELLKSVTELNSGARTLGIYRQRWNGAPSGAGTEAPQGAVTARPPQRELTIYLHGVGDPGNVGTVLRSAAAFGATGVILGAGSADPFGPKAVRASMGAIFQVAVTKAPQAEGPAALLAALPGITVALDAAGEQTLADVAAQVADSGPLTLLVGAEREGLPQELCAQADQVARIPIATESLNAAAAAAVALYELTRRISER